MLRGPVTGIARARLARRSSHTSEPPCTREVPMHSFARWILVLIGLTLALSASAAKDPNEDAIKARRAVMTLQSWYAGPLFQMAKGAMEYDAEMAGIYAAHLNTMANVEGGAMWPEGDRQTARTRGRPARSRSSGRPGRKRARRPRLCRRPRRPPGRSGGGRARCAALEDRCGRQGLQGLPRRLSAPRRCSHRAAGAAGSSFGEGRSVAGRPGSGRRGRVHRGGRSVW